MHTVSRLDDDHVPVADIGLVVRQQRRQRLVRFWIGFAVILLLGGLWAGLSKDPTGFGDVFADGDFDQPAVEMPPPDVVFTTTAVVPAPAIETTGPLLTTESGPTFPPSLRSGSPSSSEPSTTPTTSAPSTTGDG